MTVVIYAQDLSGRKDDGYYTKPDIGNALDIFFDSQGSANFSDHDGENPIAREDAEAIFQQDKRVTFYNSDGEKIVISHDASSSC